MTSLQQEVASLASAVKKGGTKSTMAPTGGKGPGGLKWRAGMKFDPTWNNKQKFWWIVKVKSAKPARYKEHMRAHYQEKLKELK